MKKVIYLSLLVLILLLSSCSKDDNPVSGNNGNPPSTNIIFQKDGVIDSLYGFGGITYTGNRIKLGILNIDTNCFVEFNYKTKGNDSYYFISTKLNVLSTSNSFIYDGNYHSFKNKCTGSGNDSCFFTMSVLNNSQSDTALMVVRDLKIYK